ncbi:MAG TPA: hypothetical protein VKA49_00270 [Flavitalea sp.]|nr:hypothetical protein [Flavitalea sp.]
MKKLCCFLLLTIATHRIAHAQIAYYSARSIFQNYVVISDTTFSFKADTASVRRLAEQLKNYLPDSIKIRSLTTDQVFGLYTRNPFFGRQVARLIGGASPFLTNIVSKGVSAVGGLDVTAVADGLAQFLIKRGKEELNVAFFQRMKKFLEENIEAKTLFPATSVFLGNIASYRYAELLQSLREAFHRDLKNLLVNLDLLIDLPKYQQLLAALPEIRVAIRSAKIVSELSQPGSSLHPANLIHHLAYLNEWHEMDMNLENSWKLLDIISESVRKQPFDIDTVEIKNGILKLSTREIKEDSTLSDTVLISGKFYKVNKTRFPKGTLIIDSAYVPITRFDTVYTNEVAWIRYINFHDDLISKPLALRIYLGLIYEKLGNISFRLNDTTIRVQDFMKAHVNDIFAVADLVENFLVLANDVEQSVKDIKARDRQALTDEDYYTYIDKAINIVEYGFKVANTIKPGISADRYIVLARNANNLYKHIYSKNYNAAVMNGYLILKEILAKSKAAVEEKKRFLDVSGSASQRDQIRTLDSALTNTNFYKDETERSKAVERILKYGNVMAGIIKSKTPEEAESAIEAAALPAGSSSIKKNSAWNISLNAYIGGYYSDYTNDIDKIDGSNSKVGVTAPVGIAFSKGLGHFRNGSSIGALSAYITVIDVGGIAGYRLNNDSTALEQKITIDDIFSPGAYLVYGLGLPFLEYVPLSIGYGWQYGSKLYFKQQDGTLGISDKSRWRGNWFLAIDIPLTNFWTKASRKK